MSDGVLRPVSAFSPEGHLFATLGADGHLWVWDVATGELATQLAGSLANRATTFAWDTSSLHAAPKVCSSF